MQISRRTSETESVAHEHKKVNTRDVLLKLLRLFHKKKKKILEENSRKRRRKFAWDG